MLSTIENGAVCVPAEAEGTWGVLRLTKGRAEDLLDWLEAHGWEGQLSLDEGEDEFAVRSG